MESQNAYSVLGVRKGASDEDIKQAYVNLVRRFDPEKHTDRFMQIQASYEALSNPAKRAKEDILTFNYIRGRFLFTAPEQTKTADAQLNQQVQDLEKAMGADPSNEETRAEYVRVLMMRSFKKVSKRLWAEAIEDWQKVLEIEPTQQRAKNNMLFSYITLGYSYAEHELYEEAIELWTKAIHMDPDNGDLIHNLAIAQELSGHQTEAKRYWAETLKRWQEKLDGNPDDVYTRNCLIEVRRHHGGQAAETDSGAPASIEEYEEILKINPDDFEAQFKIATALMEERKWADAAESLSKLVRKYPKNIEVLNMLGWAYLNGGHLERAFQAWQRALTLDPKNYSTRENIIKARMSVGKAFRNKGMHTQALVHFKALLKFTPRSPEVLMEIGQTYMMKGDKRSAAQTYQRVAQIDPKNAEARQILSDMRLRA